MKSYETSGSARTPSYADRLVNFSIRTNRTYWHLPTCRQDTTEFYQLNSASLRNLSSLKERSRVKGFYGLLAECGRAY